MSEQIKHGLMTFRGIFFREKYRFDQGNAFLVFLNFALLVITLTSANGKENFIPIFIGSGIFLTWFLGYLLDRVVKVQDAQEKEVLTRSPIWKENFQHHGNQNEKLEILVNKLEKIEKRLEKLVN